MATDEDLQIRLSYKRRNAAEVQLSLSPVDYYEPLDEGEEGFEIDSTPRFNSLCEYLDAEKTELEFVEVAIDDSVSCKSHVRRELYWRGNWMSYGVDRLNGREHYSEIIIEIQDASGESTQLIKIGKTLNGVNLIMHLLTRESDSGEYESTSIL